MQRRILLLPLIWGGYGLGTVYGLSYLFGPILNLLPFGIDDKPTSGAYMPALFFNVTMLMGFIAFSLYAIGMWNIDLSNPKSQRDLGALMIMLVSGLLIFTSALFLFPIVATLVYFMATNID
jgi:hypothetical protein